ncbi:MAG: S8 family serine peptidase, partial [Treponemataceae bacterium]
MANDILQLKGHFEQQKNPSKPGPRNIPTNQVVKLPHLINLRDQLIDLSNFWKDEIFFEKALVSVYYNDVVAKSNRVRTLFTSAGIEPNSSIVGAKFDTVNDPKHIITHCIEKKAISDSIDLLDQCILIVESDLNGEVSFEKIELINKNNITLQNISKTKFVSVIVDSFYVNRFGIDVDKDSIKDRSIVTLYKTDVLASELMRKIGISAIKYQQLDETTFILNPDQYEILRDKVPYLIAMSVTDITNLTKSDIIEIDEDPKFSIHDPTNEPIIGVIDTHFYKHAYFSRWVSYTNMLSDDIELKSDDYDHGTMVSSIIVDGPTLNPQLEDNCGHFRVRHFGVAKNGRNSASAIIRSIKHIIAENRDIKVWNFSLGSDLEINNNFISPEAAILDQIQFENDVIFIISGTNKSH